MQKAVNFFIQYLHSQISWCTPGNSISRIKKAIPTFSSASFMKNQLQKYKQVSLANNKPIKEHSFMKKLTIITELMPFSSSGYRPQKINPTLLSEIIQEIYDSCIEFLKMGWWKSESSQAILQYYVFYYLYHKYSEVESKIKSTCNKFDQFLLSIFYTLNGLKIQNKYFKNFVNFVNGSYTIGQYFLYLCLRNKKITKEGKQGVSSELIKKVTKIFQQQNDNLSVSYSSINIQSAQQKLIGLDLIFQEPLQGCFIIPRFKLFKIMKICELLPKDSDKSEWSHFLKQYFECLENTQQIITFQHIVSARLAELTFQISDKLLGSQGRQRREKFLQQAFSYLFQILEMVFCDEVPQIEDRATMDNVLALRKHYEYIKQLNNYQMPMVNKFAKKLLKNSYILNLYRKQCENSQFE